MESLYLFVKTTFFIDKILKNLEKAAQCIAAESANLKRGVDISGKNIFFRYCFVYLSWEHVKQLTVKIMK